MARGGDLPEDDRRDHAQAKRQEAGEPRGAGRQCHEESCQADGRSAKDAVPGSQGQGLNVIGVAAADPDYGQQQRGQHQRVEEEVHRLWLRCLRDDAIDRDGPLAVNGLQVELAVRLKAGSFLIGPPIDEGDAIGPQKRLHDGG